MKKSKLIISSSLAILMSATLISGATYSLFTSESSNDITISSATVDLDSSINEDKLTLYSMDELQGSTFANGGLASLEKGTGKVTLTNMTPGDEVRFKLKLTNNSNVKIKYRVKITKLDDIFADSLVLTGPSENRWETLEPSNEPIISDEYGIKFIDQGSVIDNQLQNKTTTVNIVVEAHQFNDPNIKEFNLDFFTTGGREFIGPFDIKLFKGEKVPEIPIPQLNPGYYFKGWSTSNTEYVPATLPEYMPGNDLIFYAWVVTSDTVYLDYKYEEASDSYSINGVTTLYKQEKPDYLILPSKNKHPTEEREVGVTSIAVDAFNPLKEGNTYESKLTTVDIYSPIKELSARCFANNTLLNKATNWTDSIETIGESCFINTSIKKFNFKQSVKTIEANAFYNLSSFNSLLNGENIETIGANAFSGTSITSLTLFNKIKTIGEGAFANISTLEDIYVSSGFLSTANIHEHAFGETPDFKLPDTVRVHMFDRNEDQYWTFGGTLVNW